MAIAGVKAFTLIGLAAPFTLTVQSISAAIKPLALIFFVFTGGALAATLVVVAVVVAQRWDVARPQDVSRPTRGMVQAQANVIQVRVLADQAGIPIAGNVIRGLNRRATIE